MTSQLFAKATNQEATNTSTGFAILRLSALCSPTPLYQ
jgi:hypothetical protein